MSSKKSKKPSLKVSIYRKIAFSFIALTLLLILVILYFSASKAVIIVTPVQETVGAEFNIVVKKMAGAGEGVGVVPGRFVEVVKEKTQRFTATLGGVEDVPATGKLTIINNYSASQPLVAATRFLSPDGVLFRLKNEVAVPANGKLEADVYADKPGKESEIGPTRFTIPGLSEWKQQRVYGESYAPMTGGTRRISSVTEEDINAAKEELKSDLHKLALQELKTDLKPEEKLLADSETLEAEVDTKIGAETKDFTISLRIRVTGIIFDETPAIALAEEKLKTNLPDDKELLPIKNEDFEYLLRGYDKEDGLARVAVSVDGRMVIRSTSAVLDKTKLIGLSADEVKNYFKGFNSVKDVSIRFTPFWVKRVPKLSDHVVVEVKK